jgi:hypothetical protein
VNSRLPKWMVLLGARPTPVGLLLLATKESFIEGAIRTSRGKVCYTPHLAHQLSVFFAPARTGWSRLCVPVPMWSSGLILKINRGYNVVSRELEKFT